VKLLKLLIVPAVLLFSVAVAAPTFAHHLSKATLTETCKSNGQICLQLTGEVAEGTDARTVVVQLFGDSSTTPLGEVQFSIPKFDSDHPEKNQVNETECFQAVTTGNFAHFNIKWVKVLDKDGKAADLVIELNDATLDSKNLPITLFRDVQPCVAAPPPTPQTPTPTASAAVTTTLAGTGGFDFRYPLVGLTVLVAGLALLLVSASRGRSSTK